MQGLGNFRNPPARRTGNFRRPHARRVNAFRNPPARRLDGNHTVCALLANAARRCRRTQRVEHGGRLVRGRIAPPVILFAPCKAALGEKLAHGILFHNTNGAFTTTMRNMMPPKSDKRVAHEIGVAKVAFAHMRVREVAASVPRCQNGSAHPVVGLVYYDLARIGRSAATPAIRRPRNVSLIRRPRNVLRSRRTCAPRTPAAPFPPQAPAAGVPPCAFTTRRCSLAATAGQPRRPAAHNGYPFHTRTPFAIASFSASW